MTCPRLQLGILAYLEEPGLTLDLTDSKYSSPPSLLSTGDTFQDPQWMPEIIDSAKSYIYYVFFLCIHTYDNIYTILTLWGYFSKTGVT